MPYTLQRVQQPLRIYRSLFILNLYPCCVNASEKDVNAGSTSASSAASWTGWAVSGALGGMTSLTSKIYKGKSNPNGNASASSKPATNSNPKPGKPIANYLGNVLNHYKMIASYLPLHTCMSCDLTWWSLVLAYSPRVILG